MQSENNALLLFEGPLVKDVPKAFIPYLSIIKTLSQWQALGFKVREDKNGNYKPLIRNGLNFWFRKFHRIDDSIMQAAFTGKKHVTYIKGYALHMLYYGCSFDDFVFISDDTKHYCNAFLCHENKNAIDAYKHIIEAIRLNNCVHEYHTLYFDICFSKGDISVIDEELEWYQDDIDCMVHSGNVERWLKLLIKKSEYQQAVDMMIKVNILFDELIDGKRSHKRFSPQSSSFVVYEKESLWRRVGGLKSFRHVEALAESQGKSFAVFLFLEE